MRLRAGLLILSLLILAMPSRGQEVTLPVKLPEAVIREFYQWYVHAVLQNKDPLTRNRKAMRKYVTLRLLREIDRMVKGPDGLDGDYFLDAQDFDNDWEKNIAVSNLAVKRATATATVALKGKDMNRNLQLTLRQEAGAWKIDRVKGLDN